MAGEHSELSVLGRAHLCSGGTQHRTVGQIRLLSGASGHHFFTIRVRGGDDLTLTVATWPSTGLPVPSLPQLKKGRATLTWADPLTAAQVSSLITPGTKDFRSGLSFNDGTKTYVLCPHRA